MRFENAFRIFFFAFLASSLLVLGACSKKTVQLNAKVDLIYSVEDPMTNELIVSGTKHDVKLDFSKNPLYQLLSGAQKGETRTEILQDPRNEHNADLITKQTALVLNEMGIPLLVGERVDVAGEEAIITNIVTENGIQQAVLDSNPRETLFPLQWTFTIEAIH